MRVIIPDDRGRTFNPFRVSVVVRVRWIMRRRNNGCCCQSSKRAGRGGCNDSEGNEPPGWCIYGTVALVAVGCYLNALGGDFVHDDIPAVVRNKDVLAQNPWTSILKDDFWGTPMHDINSHKSYRPLTTLTFRWVQSALRYLFVLAVYCIPGTRSRVIPIFFHVIQTRSHVVTVLLFPTVLLVRGRSKISDYSLHVVRWPV